MPITDSFYSLQGSTNSSWVYIFYGLLLGVIITIILLVSDAFFPFLPINPMGGPSPAARGGKLFWTTLPPEAENIIVHT